MKWLPLLVLVFGSSGCLGQCSTAPSPSEPRAPSLTFGAADLLPLAVGNEWTYRITATEEGDCASGVGKRAIVDRENFEQREGFAQTSFCDGDVAHLSRVGSEVQQFQQGAWRTSFSGPLEEGTTWAYFADLSLTWHHIGWVHVAAGTFPECWQRQASDASYATQIYCVGVGMVSENAPGYVAELTSYSLK